MNEFLFKQETFEIIGLCMEVHKVLGPGFSEIVYKDAIELEAKWRSLKIVREKGLNIFYKKTLLNRQFFSDFVFFDNVIVEVKAVNKDISDDNVAQTLNYLKASGIRVGLIVNFGTKSLEFKRIIF
jgi:GxxExxY protein